MKAELASWTPVTVDRSDRGFAFSLWGRTYRFENSFLPTSIETAGCEVLSAPVTLDADFGGAVGEWHDFWYLITEETEERVTVAVSAKCGNVVANATVTAEFDGFVKAELCLMSSWEHSDESEARLTGLALNVKVKPECSSLFHYWPHPDSGVAAVAGAINSGATVTADYSFKPYVWTGWEDGGLGIFLGESNKGYEPGDPARCIRVERGDCSTDITVHLLDHMPADWRKKGRDLWARTLDPLFFTVGFHATPVKPMPRMSDDYYKRMHCIWVGDEDDKTFPEHGFMYTEGYPEACAAAGVKWLILHEEWSVIQNWGRPEDEARFKAFVDKCHRLGMKVMVYFGYEYSSLAPGFSENAKDYLIRTADGSFAGGWQRKPWQRDFMVCYRGGYSDEMIRRVEHAMDDYGIDGIYTDGTFVPWECANESHGCGCRGGDGTLRPTYPILAVREHVRRLYEAVKRRGGILDAHQSSCCIMPLLSFCDSYYDGENIQELLKNDPEAMSPDSFKAEFYGRNLGIPCNFLAYSSKGYPMSYPAGFSLVHNVFPRPSQMWDLAYMSRIWRIFDEYRLCDAEWTPYFRNDRITAAGALVSLYEGDHTVAVIYGVGAETETVTLSAAGFTMARDLLGTEVYEVAGGVCELPAKPRELQMYALE